MRAGVPAKKLIAVHRGTQALGEMSLYPSGLERTPVSVLAVGDLGLIAKTTDDGATWTALTVPVSSSLFAIDCPTHDVCWAVGDNGRILKVRVTSLPPPPPGRTTLLVVFSLASSGSCFASEDWWRLSATGWRRAETRGGWVAVWREDGERWRILGHPGIRRDLVVVLGEGGRGRTARVGDGRGRCSAGHDGRR